MANKKHKKPVTLEEIDKIQKETNQLLKQINDNQQFISEAALKIAQDTYIGKFVETYVSLIKIYNIDFPMFHNDDYSEFNVTVEADIYEYDNDSQFGYKFVRHSNNESLRINSHGVLLNIYEVLEDEEVAKKIINVDISKYLDMDGEIINFADNVAYIDNKTGKIMQGFISGIDNINNIFEVKTFDYKTSDVLAISRMKGIDLKKISHC